MQHLLESMSKRGEPESGQDEKMQGMLGVGLAVCYLCTTSTCPVSFVARCCQNLDTIASLYLSIYLALILSLSLCASSFIMLKDEQDNIQNCA